MNSKHGIINILILIACCTSLVQTSEAGPTLTTDPAGGGGAHNNHQPGLGLNYIIATQGIYPSRSSDLGDINRNGLDPFLGEITMFAGNFAPRGWAFTDGQILPISQNNALFSLLGTQYGGDGRTTFALPDLRGRSPMREGAGPGLSNSLIGQKKGVDNVTLTQAQMPIHNHQVQFDPPGLLTSTDAGGNQSHTNMKPTLGINFNIALQGLFPSRNSKLADIEQSLEPFIADIGMFAGNFAPRNYASTDGQLLPINQNQALFSLLGTTYGGDGRTTFGLPDLRGRLPVHEGQGPGLSDYRLGEKGGTENETLTLNELPVHTHLADDPVLNAGGGQAHDNIQPYQAVNYIIATQGVYPSRNSDLGDIVQNIDDPFIGEVRMFAGNFAPRGWQFCDGQLLSIASNTALFSLLGTNYGGDGRTTFGLPDLQGRVPVHPGSGPGLRTWTLGEKFGSEMETLSLSQLPAHTHDYTIPEPSSVLLLMMTVVALGAWRLRG